MRRLIIALLVALQAQGAGAGLYCVKADGTVPDGCVAAKTFTEIGAALDQLKADQGATAYTATQTIRVWAGTYPAVENTHLSSMNPTATYKLIVEAAPGSTPLIDGGAAAECFAPAVSYTVLTGFEITNCGSVRLYKDHPEISYSYFHDTTGYAALFSTSATNGLKAHHNTFFRNLRGISLAAGTDCEIYLNEVGTTTAGNGITGCSTGGNGIRDNITYNGNIVNASGIQPQSGDLIEGNISYNNRYGMQTLATTVNPILRRNIQVANMYNGHCEGGAGDCPEILEHNFSYAAGWPGATGGAEMWVATRSDASPLTHIYSNISWANGSYFAADRNVRMITTAAIAGLDRNVYWKTGNPKTAVAGNLNNGQPYNTLAEWQAGSGLDTHTIEADPRIMGDPDLLVTNAQVFPDAPSIEERKRRIDINYMSTNLALKGRGCSWNGSVCVEDGSDPGPHAITTFPTPGGFVSASVARFDSFTGGMAF
jgi:hypothetical protein